MKAREQLRAVLGTFEKLGTHPWAVQGRAELAAIGEKARARNMTTRDDLTPKSFRWLAARRSVPREAAAALFLSPKTIGFHLRNIYRKLDCHSRDELADALTSRGVAD